MFIYINHPALRMKLLNATYNEHNRRSLLYTVQSKSSPTKAIKKKD